MANNIKTEYKKRKRNGEIFFCEACGEEIRDERKVKHRNYMGNEFIFCPACYKVTQK